MKDVITTLIPRYGELNRIYKDWFDNKGFSFEKQKFITKFYLDYNDVTVLETAILELVFHLPQEQYTLILNSLKKEVCENISYYKKGCMPDEQTVYNICFRVSEIYKEAIEEQQYKTTKLHAPLNEAYHRYDSIGYREHTAEDEKRAEMEYERCKDEYEEKKNKLTELYDLQKQTREKALQYAKSRFNEIYRLGCHLKETLAKYVFDETNEPEEPAAQAQPEPEARNLALSLELFTEGSLNAFAYPTNVNTQCRILVYDILDLGEQLKTMGLLVITDAILNRVTENWKAGRRTHVYLDEFHVVYENPYSSMFFTSAWRRFRKRNAFPTGITQNVEYLLDNVSARSMLSNSEFIVMHNQAASDREKLATLFNISEQQMNYITNAEAGHGLIKIGNALVPFVNRFPKNTELYRRMTTRPGETEAWG